MQKQIHDFVLRIFFFFFVFLKLDLLMHFVCIDGFDWLTYYAKFAFYMVKLTKY